jgi:hypothetical protein
MRAPGPSLRRLSLRILLRLRMKHRGDEPDRAQRGDAGEKAVAVHTGTKGPGDFRYWFLIASSDQSVSAPIVIE